MQRVLPEYAIADVPPDHPILHTMLDLEAAPQVTSINFWRESGGDSWERKGEDREYFLQFSPDGYALGINVVLYHLTH